MFNGCIPTERKYAKGTYIGDSEGYYSSLIVEVEVDDYNILSIKILEDEEPPILADIVFEKLPPIIIKNNGTDVDVISGATYTSKALLDAVNKAIDESRRLLDETSD
jgi:uncharacterized protein with FMN-binding domain